MKEDGRMKSNLSKAMKMFGIMWIFTGIGAFIGQYTPTQLITPVAIITLLLVIGLWFTYKSVAASSILVYLVALLIGITLYSAIGFYAGELGVKLVIVIIGTCTITFAFLGLFGYKIKKDLQNWGMILFVALIGLVVFSLIAVFVGLSNITMVIVSGLGVLVFLGFTVYDFNQIAKRNITENDIPSIALGLYLDFINLVLQALRLVLYIKN